MFISCLQKPTTGGNPEPGEFNPRPPTLLFKTIFTGALPCKRVSHKYSLSLKSFQLNCAALNIVC